MRKINEEKEKNKPDIKSFINIFEKSRNKKQYCKLEIHYINI